MTCSKDSAQEVREALRGSFSASLVDQPGQ